MLVILLIIVFIVALSIIETKANNKIFDDNIKKEKNDKIINDKNNTFSDNYESKSTKRFGLELVKWRKDKEKYLLSSKWEKKRKERLLIDNNMCQLCSHNNIATGSRLEIHHLTYKNLKNENVNTDLVTLCQDHHKAVHDYIGFYTDDDFHEIPYNKIELREY